MTATTHTNSSFRQGKPTYICQSCGIRTRETGDGESGCELCADCFYIAGEDNLHNDSGTKPNEADRKNLDAAIARIAKKGGNVQAVKDSSEYAFPVQS